jgi:hypothetical protein
MVGIAVDSVIPTMTVSDCTNPATITEIAPITATIMATLLASARFRHHSCSLCHLDIIATLLKPVQQVASI